MKTDFNSWYNHYFFVAVYKLKISKKDFLSYTPRQIEQLRQMDSSYTKYPLFEIIGNFLGNATTQVNSNNVIECESFSEMFSLARKGGEN